jgi:cytochrome b subunit of formate dehydrogenase
MVEIPAWLEFTERFFVVLTAALVAFGILNVEMELLHWVGSRLRPGGEHHRPLSSQAGVSSVVRFDIHQRLQHILLMAAFIVLAFTGLAQKFYRFPPSDSFIQLLGGMETLRLIHRGAAFLLVADVFYHLWHLSTGLLRSTGEKWQDILPNLQDVKDFFQTMAYYLGMRSRPVPYGRFSYMQKFDYWAVFWGMAVMGISGMVLMFSGIFARLGGTPLVAVSLVAHSDEAVLAVGWIAIVHMFHAHINPRVFPFNATIFTGRIPVRLLLQEHALEYRRLFGELPPGAEEGEEAGPVVVAPAPSQASR